jgi:hypothetical protein
VWSGFHSRTNDEGRRIAEFIREGSPATGDFSLAATGASCSGSVPGTPSPHSPGSAGKLSACRLGLQFGSSPTSVVMHDRQDDHHPERCNHEDETGRLHQDGVGHVGPDVRVEDGEVVLSCCHNRGFVVPPIMRPSPCDRATQRQVCSTCRHRSALVRRRLNSRRRSIRSWRRTTRCANRYPTGSSSRWRARAMCVGDRCAGRLHKREIGDSTRPHMEPAQMGSSHLALMDPSPAI